jgi:hypothetical protein
MRFRKNVAQGLIGSYSDGTANAVPFVLSFSAAGKRPQTLRVDATKAKAWLYLQGPFPRV